MSVYAMAEGGAPAVTSPAILTSRQPFCTVAAGAQGRLLSPHFTENPCSGKHSGRNDPPEASANAARIGSAWDVRTSPDRVAPAHLADPVARFLAAAFSNPRAGVITRRPGEGWRSEPAAWPLERIAAAVHDSARIVGIRPEGLIRLLLVDIDRKPDRVSPYWHPYGQSRQLLALEREAAAAGCSVTLLRSSASGGLHALIALPEPVKAWRAHWLALELVSRAGMKEAPGVCEVFPSRLDYSNSADPASWAQSHGYRLPGQDGSALICGTRTASDPELIYGELLEALEGTEAGPSWGELLEAAAARQRATRVPRATHRPRHASRRAHGVRWTAAGQSEQNLRLLTSWARAAHPQAVTEEALGPLIEAAALNAPGFDRWASAETRRDLSGWCRRWARCSLRRDRAPHAPTPKGDKDHNKRLMRQSQAALTRLWRKLRTAAASMSQRAVADSAGLDRKTLRRHWDYWLRLVTGPYPAITGGAALAVPCLPSIHLSSSVPPARLAEVFTSAATVETSARPPDRRSGSGPVGSPDVPHRAVMPFRPEVVPPNSRKARELAELEAWLGLTA